MKEKITSMSAEKIGREAADRKSPVMPAQTDEEITAAMHDDPDWAGFDGDWSNAAVVRPLRSDGVEGRDGISAEARADAAAWWKDFDWSKAERIEVSEETYMALLSEIEATETDGAFPMLIIQPKRPR